MSFKKITKALSDVRNNIRVTGEVTMSDRQALQELVEETIKASPDELKALPRKVTGRIAFPGNDNKMLTPDQRYKLRIIEKTGTGSTSVH